MEAPKPPLRLILVRHGETACNTDNIWHGWDECELTETGQAQARAVGQRLAGEPIDAVYSSPAQRARQTAERIAAPHDLTPILDPGLRERNAGEFEGVPVEEVVARHPTVWEERAADVWNWSPPGGETFSQVLARSLAVVDRIRTEHPGETVALVSHMGPVRVLISHFGGISLAETYALPFPATGISIVTLDGAESRLDVLNDAGHVGDPV